MRVVFAACVLRRTAFSKTNVFLNRIMEQEMASIERTAYPRLTGRMSEAGLRQSYSLTEDEKALVLQSANGSSGRLTFAVLLKTRQSLGYFPSVSEVPESVLRHMTEQLSLEAGTRLADAEHLRKSRSRYRLAIRAHLGCRLFADVGNDVVVPAIAVFFLHFLHLFFS